MGRHTRCENQSNYVADLGSTCITLAEGVQCERIEGHPEEECGASIELIDIHGTWKYTNEWRNAS